MPLPLEFAPNLPPSAMLHDERFLTARVRAEFREMPGLKLTLPQAARLFGIEQARRERVLRILVNAGELVTDGGTFARPTVERRTA